MCRWHKHAVKMAATDPVTGDFDVAKYAVGLTAMAMFRVEQTRWQMPELFQIDGFNPAEILTPETQAAFARSGLERPMPEVEAALARSVETLRRALDETAGFCDLSKEGLNITDNITKDGYKKTCCASPNPRENGPFLDAAVVYLVKGYDDDQRSFASGPLTLIDAEDLLALENDLSVAEADRRHIPLLEGVRSAAGIFLARPGVTEALEEAFKASVAYIFQTAQDDLDHGRGLEGPSDCIMCEGALGRKAQQPPAQQPA